MEKIKKYIPFNNIPIIILLCLFDIIIIGIDCEFRNALIIVKRFTEMFFKSSPKSCVKLSAQYLMVLHLDIISRSIFPLFRLIYQ